MALTRDEVLHVAKLARVGLTEDDVTKLQKQLSEIMAHFDVLQRFDTTDVAPTTYSLPLQNVMADDIPTPSLTHDEMLANAPDSQDGYLKVRAVLDDA